MSFEIFFESPTEPFVFETAAEALAACTDKTTSIWLDGHTIGHEELKYRAEQEALAPDPEEIP
jgi:hypothetical protein